MKSEIRQLITQSFLSQARKGELLDLLVERGGDEEFFRIFNEYLSEDIKEKSIKYQEVIKGFDDGASRVDAEFMSEEERAMKALEQTLHMLAVDDIAGKQIAWDEYYMKIERSEKTYDQSLRKLGADIVMAN